MGCYNSVAINVPADEVWKGIRNFHDMSWAPNVITRLEAEGDPAQAGAKRVLNGVFFETLHEVDDEQLSVRYSIDDGPDVVAKDKVTGYVGQVQVFPITADNTAFVLWTSRWESESGGVAEFCNPIYQALLADMKQHFE